MTEVHLVSAVADPGVLRFRVVNIQAMATKFPGSRRISSRRLTAVRWEQYRRALFIAKLTDQVDQFNQEHGAPPTPAHTSVTWQNVEFLRTHREDFAALVATGMWFPRTQLDP